MYEWSEEQLAIRDAVRRFVSEEVEPNVEELEHGETPPYVVIRKLYSTFGLDVLARESAKKAIERKANGDSGATAERAEGGGGGGATAAFIKSEPPLYQSTFRVTTITTASTANNIRDPRTSALSSLMSSPYAAA